MIYVGKLTRPLGQQTTNGWITNSHMLPMDSNPSRVPGYLELRAGGIDLLALLTSSPYYTF
jgi:hypothetical protein